MITARARPCEAEAIRSARGTACTALRFRYKGLADKEYDPQRLVRVAVRADGRAHQVTLGAYAALRLNHEGILRVEFECDGFAVAEIGTMKLLEPQRASYYRERYLERLKKD